MFRATGKEIIKNSFRGNYEDHIHFSASDTLVSKNSVVGATQIGIAIIQETESSFSTNNVLLKNRVENSGLNGIQIQGDNNFVLRNRVSHKGGVGIKLCGSSSSPVCVPPGSSANASTNVVTRNFLANNSGGNIVNYGSNNVIENP